jgi:glycine cleavage system H protein
MNIPENLRYTKDHEWIRMEADHAYVGITDYAQGELGDIVFVEIETLEAQLQQGDVFGTIEAVKTVSDLFMPVTGIVTEINPALNDSPELINTDPFGKGWLIKVSHADKSQINNLLTAAQYKELISA